MARPLIPSTASSYQTLEVFSMPISHGMSIATAYTVGHHHSSVDIPKLLRHTRCGTANPMAWIAKKFL
jgi:hypothetical protein